MDNSAFPKTTSKPNANPLIIGLMSGTSVDGIDAALVEFESKNSLKVIETQFTAFEPSLRTQINATALNNTQLFCNEDSSLHRSLAPYYAQASLNLIKQAGLTAQDITAIANHGQTVRHEPNASPAFSLQLGDGQLIAEQTGILTISQFRQADLEAGGQGAPLMPAFHKAFFDTHKNTATFVLNLGGIANITQLNDDIIGFDTGPSNTLMDQWIDRHQHKSYDHDGAWALSGKVQVDVLEKLMQTPYFHAPYPKSTGTDYFNLHWLEKTVENLNTYKPADIQATLLALTIDSITLGLSQLEASKGTLYVCGGGSHNSHLMNKLRERLGQTFEIRKTDQLGVPADWVEAVGFAWLGYCHLNGIVSNIPSVTGAKKALVLGQAFHPTST